MSKYDHMSYIELIIASIKYYFRAKRVLARKAVWKPEIRARVYKKKLNREAELAAAIKAEEDEINKRERIEIHKRDMELLGKLHIKSLIQQSKRVLNEYGEEN